jgi:hypothetical protein
LKVTELENVLKIDWATKTVLKLTQLVKVSWNLLRLWESFETHSAGEWVLNPTVNKRNATLNC